MRNSRIPILVIEDEELVLEVICLLLAQEGYLPLPAKDEESALNQVKVFAGKIPLLLTDMRLRKGNGPEVAKNIRSLQPEIRVIYMSGYPAAEFSFLDCLRKDEAYLEKPFKMDQFRLLIPFSMAAKRPGSKQSDTSA